MLRYAMYTYVQYVYASYTIDTKWIIIHFIIARNL